MDIRSILIELCEAFNAHDVDGVMALMTEDVVFEKRSGAATERVRRDPAVFTDLFVR